MTWDCKEWRAVHDKEPGADEGGPALIITAQCGPFDGGGHKARLEPRETDEAGKKEALFDLVIHEPETADHGDAWAKLVYRENTHPRAKFDRVRIFHEDEERWGVDVEVIK